ncbi:unnamed protein product [Zymoseptoria tritici ST99CH_1E4]|uniref:CAP-Gly domain-containing protein n=1 Tax=Zymoseptoria tritici ST99CH_1E4 TaxID=1276532 RepID=A0A2H1FL17_ZYMTR|nr:unnamed protein product [Zymoseptoria tritici ST99CH_1E4]
MAFAAGQRIELNDGKAGTIRFAGPTAFQTGDWIGVELEEPTGKNDGSVQGQRYFDCAPKYGIFCRASGISRVIEEPTPKPKAANNGAPVRARPSSVQDPANGARRQTLREEAAARRSSTVAGTPTPASRVASGMRSPAKSPTKQLGISRVSSASTSRTSTPPTGVKRPPIKGVAAKPSSTIPPGSRRTSTLPPTSASASARTSRPSLAAGPTSAASYTRGGLARGPPPARSPLRDRLQPTAERPIRDVSSERTSQRESASSSAVSQTATTDDGEDEAPPNFAPPSMPPPPPEPVSRARRPSSPAAASIHSQRTIRSTAASTRQIEELEAKLKVLERKRMEDREVKQQLELAVAERDKYQAVIEKLQTKYRPQQQELEKLKRDLAEYEERIVAIDDLKAQHEVDMESAIMDRELAQEESANHKDELEALREKNEELVLELEILKEENSEYTKEMTSEERSSTGYLQLVRTNERLKDALIRLRDITQDKEAELKDQIDGLQERLKEADEAKIQFEETKEKLLRSQSDTEDLRQQLEVAQGAEEMIETMAEDNETLRNKLNELRAVIEDLESLREINDELEINHVETEKQLQEELDFKDSLLMDRERTSKQQQAALDQADFNINRFRELVTQLTGDLQDLQASKQITEAEASQLSSKSRAMMDLNTKLQSSAAKTQVKQIDLELRKLDAEQASEHLAIVQLFLPESFKAERDSVLALLRFKRIGFKANLVQTFVKERIASFGTRGQDEEVFAACDALAKLTWIGGMSERLVNSISSCSPDAFAQYGSALFELEVVERTLNDYVDALRRDELKESDMTVRLGRSIEVMTHLSSLHISDGLPDHADKLIMKTMLVQSHLESATSALTVTRTLLESNLSDATDEDAAVDDETASENALLLTRLKSIIEQVRNAKVISSKTHRALVELKLSSLALESSLFDSFEGAASIAAAVVAYACESGTALQELFGEEGRAEPFTMSEVASILARVANKVFSTSDAEAGPYATLNGQLRELSSQLSDLSTLPTDLDNTVEFERAPEPWVARADDLKRTKITSIDTEAELTRTLEIVRERDIIIKQKERELDEQSIKIETLEARYRDAGKRTAKIAELERALREAKESESKAKKDIALARHEAQQDIDRAREEMSRLADERSKSGKSDEIDDDAMGAGTRFKIKRDEWKAAGMESAIRFLREDNIRLRQPAPNSPTSIAKAHKWIFEPLVPSVKAQGGQQRSVVGSKVVEQMLTLATMPSPVDLTKIPDNKLAWRPAKESSRWQVERRKEEWLDWKAWAESVAQPQREVARDVPAMMVAV